MNFNLPFYGKKGTIKSIVENEKSYTVYRYELDGNDDIISNVPKNIKNYSLLIENYYNDLKGYLETYSSKYEFYKNSRLNKKVNSNLINVLMLLSVVMIGTSIPLLLNFESLGILGVTLDVLSIPALITTVRLSVKEFDDKKKISFIDEYQKMEYRYRLFNDEKTKQNNITKYTGLQKIDEKNKVIDLNLVKELKKAS